MMTLKKPKFVKYIYKHKEILWVTVDNIKGQYVYGKIINNPVTKCLLFGDNVKLKLCDSMYVP